MSVRFSQQSRRTRRTARQRPHLFGRGGRDRVLTCIAVNGPLHVRAISRLIGSDSRKTFDMVRQLEEAGLVLKRNDTGARRIVALDKQMGLLYFKLRDLLLALDEHWPVKRTDETPFYPKAQMRGTTPLDDDRIERWFTSVPRSRTLLYVAAVGRTNMSDLSVRANVGPGSALNAVNFWERQGVLRSDVFGIHRVVELNEAFPVADELWRVLNALVSRSEKYAELRRVALEIGPYREALR